MFRHATQHERQRRVSGNAVAESFFGTLKAELLADQPETRFVDNTQAARLIDDSIENFYNCDLQAFCMGQQMSYRF